MDESYVLGVPKPGLSFHESSMFLTSHFHFYCNSRALINQLQHSPFSLCHNAHFIYWQGSRSSLTQQVHFMLFKMEGITGLCSEEILFQCDWPRAPPGRKMPPVKIRLLTSLSNGQHPTGLPSLMEARHDESWESVHFVS